MFVKATVECPHCPKQFHQIDSDDERALSIARDATARHIATEHPADAEEAQS